MEVGCSGDSQIEIGVVFPTKRTRMPLRAAGRRVSNCYCRSYVATGDVAVSTAGPLQGLTPCVNTGLLHTGGERRDREEPSHV